MTEYGVVLFHNSTAAMKAEAVLGRARLATKLIPTPREFSSDCGIALRFLWSQVEPVRTALDGAHVEITRIRRMARS
jgi:hypothetical protein